MTVLSKKLLSRRASHLFKWFEIDLTIKIFGKVIFHWHYPPESSQMEEFVEYDDENV